MQLIIKEDFNLKGSFHKEIVFVVLESWWWERKSGGYMFLSSQMRLPAVTNFMNTK